MNKFWRHINIGLFQSILWISIIIIVNNSSACAEDKVLWFLLCIIGFNYSYCKWNEYSMGDNKNG